MDLQLLARAKLLLASSTEINTADANDGPAAGKGLPPRTVPKNGFVVSVIPGSSLINTSVDVRLCVRRGGEVLIDGMPYATALDGEWSSSCIQLSTDFIGDTKFDARLTLSKDAEPPRFNTNSDKQKTSIKPVASTDIAGAVQNLSAVQRDFKVKKDEMKMASRQTTFRNKKDVSANSEFSRVGAELDKIDRENVREESPRAPLFPNSLGASEASAERKTGSMRGLYRSPHSTKRERERVSSSKSLESDKRDYVSTIPSPRAAYDYSSILQEAAAVALAVTEDPAEAAKRRVKERIARRRKKQIAEQQQQEEEERARLEREEAKVKQMQERTRQRVKKLREEAKQREEEEREWMELKMREVKEREAAFDNPERQERARAIRREAASRYCFAFSRANRVVLILLL